MNVHYSHIKNISEKRIIDLGFKINKNLPKLESMKHIKSASEIAKRFTIISVLYDVIIDYQKNIDSRKNVIEFFKNKGIYHSLSSQEKNFLRNKSISEKELISVSWTIECNNVFLWTLGYIDELGLIEKNVNLAKANEKIKNNFKRIEDFFSSVGIIDTDKIIQELDFYYRLTSILYHEKRNSLGKETELWNFVYERYRALSWIASDNDRNDAILDI